MIESLQRAGRRGFAFVEGAFDAAFDPRFNPFYHLGALAFFCFWVVAASGIYLFVFFETSIEGAYRSVEQLTHEQWYLGGVARSLHRYGSDAMVVVTLLHLAREFALDRYRGVRWYAWITGAMLLWFLYAAGIGGYWLVWDRLAQYIAVVTAEWLDWLPLFSESIARNFLYNETVSDRFFSLLVFMHIGIPLFLLLGMWIHIQRISRAKTAPPRALVLGTLAALTALSLVYPALSRGPADLGRVTSVVRPDWFYLALYPLVDLWSPGAVWWLAGSGTLLLMALPWLPRRPEAPAAVVSLSNCNGCGRCFADCPYSAVIMQPRRDGLPFPHEAAVNPDLCTACGICVGACPTATPFRRAMEPVAGIDVPRQPVRELRDRTLAAAARLTGPDRVLVYACGPGVDPAALQSAGAGVVWLPCVGALPPAFIDFVISRRHADGVMLAGCAAGDCYHRLGADWTEQRLAGKRDPYLRGRVPRERVATVWVGPNGSARLQRELAAFRERLQALGPRECGGRTPPETKEVRDAAHRVG